VIEMSQPEESRPKTTETDDVLLRPDEDPHKRTGQIAPRDEQDRGQVRVELEGDPRAVEEEPR
jgi:hypothetical protein